MRTHLWSQRQTRVHVSEGKRLQPRPVSTNDACCMAEGAHTIRILAASHYYSTFLSDVPVGIASAPGEAGVEATASIPGGSMG